jgi:putative tryptophan/tyrosine transport system substrate-binding protein
VGARPGGRRLGVQGALVLSLVLACLLAGCVPSVSQAPKQPKVARIGYLSGSSTTVVGPLLESFRQGLRDQGYADDRDFTIEVRLAEGKPDRLPDLAAELIQLQPDLILSSGDQALAALKAATSTIPVVMVSCDAVAAGLIESLARPGGNFTGTTCISSVVSTKRLEYLRDSVGRLARVGLLWNAGDAGKTVEARETQTATRTLGLEVLPLEVRKQDDFQPAFDTVTQERTDGLIVLGEAFTLAHRAIITDFAARSRLPAIYAFREFVDAGGLMAYGTNLVGQFRHAATYADKILKGAKPADLPVEQPTKFDFVINLKAADALGLSIPQSVLVQATEIIR